MNHESTLFLYQFISISAIIRGAAHRRWGSLFATLVATLISWERSLQRRGSQSSDPWEFPDCQMALACFSCHVLARSIFFFLQLNFLDIFAKKRQRNRHGWSDGTRHRDLEDLQNSTQRISASRGISGDGLSERLSSLSVDIFGCHFEVWTGLLLKILNILHD